MDEESLAAVTEAAGGSRAALVAAAARARSDPGSCAVVLVEGMSDQAALAAAPGLTAAPGLAAAPGWPAPCPEVSAAAVFPVRPPAPALRGPGHTRRRLMTRPVRRNTPEAILLAHVALCRTIAGLFLPFLLDQNRRPFVRCDAGPADGQR